MKRPSFTLPVDILKLIKQLLHDEDAIHAPVFKFDVSKEDAKFNFNILEENNFHFGILLDTNEKRVTNHKSEFKLFGKLEDLLKNHPIWESLKELIQMGCGFPIFPLDSETRIKHVEVDLKRCNHKSD